MKEQPVSNRQLKYLKKISPKMNKFESIILMCSSGALAIVNFLVEIGDFFYFVSFFILLIGLRKFYKK